MKECTMQMNDIRSIAKDHGLKTSRLAKGDIIRLIQKSEGNFDCFASPQHGYCDQMACLWRDDCLKSVKATRN